MRLCVVLTFTGFGHPIRMLTGSDSNIVSQVLGLSTTNLHSIVSMRSIPELFSVEINGAVGNFTIDDVAREERSNHVTIDGEIVCLHCYILPGLIAGERA